MRSNRLEFGVVALLLLALIIPALLIVRQQRLNSGFVNAMLEDDLPAARDFLERGADPNTLDHINGWFQDVVMGTGTSNHLMLYAIGHGDVDKASLLLEYGVDVDSCDGQVPNLQIAVSNGWPEMVKILLDQGADPDRVAFTTQSTALHMAAQRGSVVNTKLLLDAGANPNVGDKLGLTPLHRAVAGKTPKPPHWAMDNLDNWDPGNKHAEVIKILISAGADPTIASNSGRTPADAALEDGREDLLTLLRDEE